MAWHKKVIEIGYFSRPLDAIMSEEHSLRLIASAICPQYLDMHLKGAYASLIFSRSPDPSAIHMSLSVLW